LKQSYHRRIYERTGIPGSLALLRTIYEGSAGDSSEVVGLTPRSVLNYGHYQVRAYGDSTGNSFIGLFDRGRPVMGVSPYDEASGIGYWLDSLLGHGTRQLVLQTYPLNTHCCYYYTIIDLADSARTVYSDEVFGDLVFYMEPLDLDGDGISEIIRPVGSFDYFYAPHTESAFPSVVLKYSRSERRYVVASNQFEKYLLRGIDSLKEIVSKCERNSTYDNGSSSEERCFPSILWVVLDYVYAGRRDLGWDFFNNHYRASDKEVIRSKIEGVLRGSPVYRMTYAN
jgi:hypothetical protein